MRVVLSLLVASAAAACAQLSGFEDGELRHDAAPADPDGPEVTGVDAHNDEVTIVDHSLVCDPLLQTGCAAGEMCSWIRVQSTPERIGMLGCVPAGTVPLDGTCTVGPEGETTGFDNCAAGGICINGRCKDICGFDGTQPGAQCPTGHQCTRYAHTFEDAMGNKYAGACNAVCDPITQRQLLPGSPPCPAGDGCYIGSTADDSIAICAPVGSVGHDQDITGPAYTNSCVPGAMVRLKEPGSNVVQCGGLCRPAHVTVNMNTQHEGGIATPEAGDADNCQSRWGAAAPGLGGSGESCRYYWSREPFEHLSPYSNSVGWCFKHAAFQYDSDGDGEPDTPWPRCTQLTESDSVPPMHDPPMSDALEFWCTPHPGPMTLRAAIVGVRTWQARRAPRLDAVFAP